MKRPLAIVFALSLMLLSFSSERSNSPDVARKKWVSIFNGKNFDGWTIRVVGKPIGENFNNTFRVENGIISIRYDQYKSFDNTFGALFYNKKLTNYRLRLQYRFIGETPAVGCPSWGYKDSGIQYHSQSPESMGEKQPFPVCLEYNLHGGNGKEERPTGELCANGTIVNIDGKPNPSFCNLPTVKKTFTGEEWITLEIDVQGPKIAHFVNGEKVLEFDDPRYNPANELGRQFIIDGQDKVTSGYISLQSNSHPIDFRKIELMEY